MNLVSFSIFSESYTIPQDIDGDYSASEERDEALRSLSKKIEEFVAKTSNQFGSAPKTRINTTCTISGDTMHIFCAVTCEIKKKNLL